MAGFDAGGSTTTLDFDFSTSKVADEAAREILKDAKGTIAEPTQKMVDDYRKAMLRTVKDPELEKLVEVALSGRDVTKLPPADLVRLMGEMPEDKLLKAMDGQHEHLIKICGGNPSKKQIMALPPRERAAFFGWLAGELFEDPTVPTAGSTPSPVGANGVGPTTG